MLDHLADASGDQAAGILAGHVRSDVIALAAGVVDGDGIGFGVVRVGHGALRGSGEVGATKAIGPLSSNSTAPADRYRRRMPTASLSLRQVALVATDLEAVVDRLGDELGLEVAHRDPAVARFGLVNAVLPVGRQFLEVVSPTGDGTAAGRQLDRLGGDGGYMVICQTDDQAPFRRRAEQLGIRTAFEFSDDGYLGWQLHPGDTGGSFLEIDQQPPGDDDPWMPAGAGWRSAVRTDVVDGIAGVELEVDDPAEVAARWSVLLDRHRFDDAELRWSTGRRGLAVVDLRATDRGRAGDELQIGAVTLRLV